MALGFCISHDNLVTSECHKLNLGSPHNAPETEQEKHVNSVNDILGKIIVERQTLKSSFFP